jgi:hypothetical protein
LDSLLLFPGQLGVQSVCEIFHLGQGHGLPSDLECHGLALSAAVRDTPQEDDLEHARAKLQHRLLREVRALPGELRQRSPGELCILETHVAAGWSQLACDHA